MTENETKKKSNFLTLHGGQTGSVFLINSREVKYVKIDSKKTEDGMESIVEYHLSEGNYITSSEVWSNEEWKNSEFKDDFKSFIADYVNKMLNGEIGE